MSTEIQWNNCDSLTGWRSGQATVTLDHVDKTEGTASIVLTPTVLGWPEIWHEEGSIDLRPYNKVRFNIKPDSDRNLVFLLVQRRPGETPSYTYYRYNLYPAADKGLTLGQWNYDVDIIIAEPDAINGTPDLADITLHSFRFSPTDLLQRVKVDNMRLVYEPIPMTASLTPTEVTLYTSQSQTFQADIKQGVGPYTVEWLIDGGVVSTVTVGNPGDHMAVANNIINFASVDVYTIQVRVTDSLGEQIVSNVSTVTVESGGLLQIVAHANGSEIIVQVTVAGVIYYTPINVWMPSGNHVITAKYRTQTDSKTANVLEGQTIPLQFQFAYEPPLPTSLHIVGRDIKDSLGRVVRLITTMMHGFEDIQGGKIKTLELQYTNDFNEVAWKQNLDAIKAWGYNGIRIIFRASFWLDPTLVDKNGLSMRDCFKLLAQWANERGLYVVYCMFCLDRMQGNHKIPWGTSTFPTLQDFINFWLSMVAELDQYPNVLYELHNEITGDKDTWLDGCQATITAMRTQTDHIIVLGYWWDVSYREYVYEGAYWVWNLYRWILDPRTQGKNILPTTHMYGDSRGYLQPEGSTVKTYFHLYNDVKRAMIAEKLQEFVVIHNRPLWIGEFGGWAPGIKAWTPEEYIACDNALTILDEWGISYCIMRWWTWERDGLCKVAGNNGMDWNDPTEWGLIAKSHLVTPTPPDGNGLAFNLVTAGIGGGIAYAVTRSPILTVFGAIAGGLIGTKPPSDELTPEAREWLRKRNK